MLIQSQVAYPYVALSDYEVGLRLLKLHGVYSAADMAREAAVVKFMWALSQNDPDEVMSECFRFKCRKQI